MPSNRELILWTVKENVSLSAFDPATGEVGGLFVITGCGDGTL